MGTIDTTLGRGPGTGRAALLACALLALPLLAHGARLDTGPHWKADACDTCHAGTPAAGAPALKTTPGHEGCAECHDGRDASVCRHRSDIVPEAGRAGKFKDGFGKALVDGAVTCTTCHDMTPHCARDVKQRYRNPSFLRNGPFEDTSDQCFSCHSKREYRQPSPHMQIKRGEIKEGHCIFCHGTVPQKDASGEWLPVQFGTSEPLYKLCSGCHTVGPHPSSSITGHNDGRDGWMHFVVPDEERAQNMQVSVSERGGHLPLDPTTGEIFCGTCHNPHDPRLEGYPVSGEDTMARLRYSKMCGVCHAEY